MNKRRFILGILGFSLALGIVLYALDWKEKERRNFEHIEETKQQLQVIIEAIDTFQLRQGRLPATLNELVPEFLKEIPTPKYGDPRIYYREVNAEHYFEMFFRQASGSETILYNSSSKRWYHYRS